MLITTNRSGHVWRLVAMVIMYCISQVSVLGKPNQLEPVFLHELSHGYKRTLAVMMRSFNHLGAKDKHQFKRISCYQITYSSARRRYLHYSQL
jgi:hypothetical protein